MRDSQTEHRVIGKDGLSGVLLDPLPGRSAPDAPVRIRLASGQVIEIPASMLVLGSDGTFLIPLGAEDLLRSDTPGSTIPATSTHADRPRTAGADVIPVIAEELIVDKKRVQTGAVRVHRRVTEHDEMIEVPLLKESLDVRRVAVDREVDGPLPIRHEGDVTIIPIVEEVLVVKKLYRLKEEVYVSRTLREEVHREEVTVRRQEAEVEQLDAGGRVREVPAAAREVVEPVRKPRKSILGEL